MDLLLCEQLMFNFRTGQGDTSLVFSVECDLSWNVNHIGMDCTQSYDQSFLWTNQVNGRNVLWVE